jgi:hypothetical protein
VDKGQPHKLLTTHHYEAHATAEKPASREVIVAAIKKTIETIGVANLTTFELWREQAISSVCGGWLEVLIDVVDQDESFVLHREGRDAEDWLVEFPGADLQSWQDPWAENSEGTEDDTESYEDEYSEEYEEEEENEEEDQDEAGDASEVTVVTDWATAEAEGWAATDSDILKVWAEWKPASEWIEESGWD